MEGTPIERRAMNTKSHERAKSEDTPRRSARVQASWQRKDAMDVFGSSKARAQKSDGKHWFFVMVLRLHRIDCLACSLVSLAVNRMICARS